MISMTKSARYLYAKWKYIQVSKFFFRGQAKFCLGQMQTVKVTRHQGKTAKSGKKVGAMEVGKGHLPYHNR
jgi:hypothetical protein